MIIFQYGRVPLKKDLVVRENQFYRGVLIAFQADAPLIHFQCIPIE